TRFLAPAEPVTVFRLRPGEKASRDFALRPAASLLGQVMLDLGNKAEGVPDVLLRVRGTHQDVFTDSMGRFYIPGLEAGEVTLEIIPWSLPKNTELSGPAEKVVHLVAGRPVHAGVFVLRPKETKVLQMFEN
ncbi:MAG TPA: hypothetical protein VFP10_06090, partial [Candidatus Eisenbacteria bacterium]|nr:hypothetical protein [Candidatus Eisenbacteria bacterium]